MDLIERNKELMKKFETMINTAEIVINPVLDGIIRRKKDEITGLRTFSFVSENYHY